MPCMLKLKENRYDFFPSNRALALCNMDDEVGESKLDDISMDVKFLVQKNKQEVKSPVLFPYIYLTTYNPNTVE